MGFPRLILRLGWAWLILIGYILFTPIGPICISCGTAFQPHNSLGRPAIVTLGIISAVLGIVSFAVGAKAQSAAAGKAAGR